MVPEQTVELPEMLFGLPGAVPTFNVLGAELLLSPHSFSAVTVISSLNAPIVALMDVFP